MNQLESITARDLAMIAIAAAVGVAIAWIDARPTWDDTGITAGMVFVSSGCLSFISPRYPWAIALAIGVWIPIWGIASQGNVASGLALAIAFAGAYGGMLFRRLISRVA